MAVLFTLTAPVVEVMLPLAQFGLSIVSLKEIKDGVKAVRLISTQGLKTM